LPGSHVLVAGLPTAGLELEADRFDDLQGLGSRRALERQVGRDQDVGIAVALVFDVGAAGRWQRLDVTGAASAAARGRVAASTARAVVVAATTCGDKGESADQHHQQRQ
jgi:hypothetical protein